MKIPLSEVNFLLSLQLFLLFALREVTSTVSGKLWRSDLVQNGCHVNKLVKLQENICLCALISKFLVSKLIESSSKNIKELSDVEVGGNCA